jgi:hypothetical protein
MNWPPPNLVDLHRHHDTSHTPESISRVSRLLHIPALENQTIEQIRKQVQAPPGSSFDEWYSCLKEVRKAYVSTAAVADPRDYGLPRVGGIC